MNLAVGLRLASIIAAKLINKDTQSKEEWNAADIKPYLATTERKKGINKECN